VTGPSDVVAVGTGRGPARLVTVRLGGPDLHDVWRRDDLHEHAVPGAFYGLTAIVRAGRLVVAGSVNSGPPNVPGLASVFSVLSLDATDGVLGACGDAVADVGETCDDGLTDGGCCAGDCSALLPDGSACDDSNACTIGDACAAGTCHATAPLPCEPCGTCDPGLGCIADMVQQCRAPTTTNAATLVVAQRKRGGRHLAWTMRSGPATSVSEFGNPLADTGYAICAYSGGQIVARAVAPAGSCGGGRKCWHRTRRGFEYENPRAPEGISLLSLRAGRAGRTRLRAVARGPQLITPSLPLEQSDLVVQLRRTDDRTVCWDADHRVIVKNRDDLLRATGD
jgi:hypothetical protein